MLPYLIRQCLKYKKEVLMSKKKALNVLSLVSKRFQTALEQARKDQQEILEDPNLSDKSGWQKTAIRMKSPIPGLEAGLEILKSVMQEQGL